MDFKDSDTCVDPQGGFDYIRWNYVFSISNFALSDGNYAFSDWDFACSDLVIACLDSHWMNYVFFATGEWEITTGINFVTYLATLEIWAC